MSARLPFWDRTFQHVSAATIFIKTRALSIVAHRGRRFVMTVITRRGRSKAASRTLCTARYASIEFVVDNPEPIDTIRANRKKEIRCRKQLSALFQTSTLPVAILNAFLQDRSVLAHLHVPFRAGQQEFAVVLKIPIPFH